MEKMDRGHGLKKGLLTMLLLGCTAQVSAFEGDYIWEERFKRQVAKAQAGQAKDQYLVANMYLRGRGTKKDIDQALHWYLQAANQGHTRAAYKAGHLYLHQTQQLAEASPAQALPWIRKAAQAGYIQAQYDLGQMYSAGKGVQRDEAQALKWLGRAKAAGYTPADSAFAKTVSSVLKAALVNAGEKSKKGSDSIARASTHLADSLNPKVIILHSNWRSQEGPSTFLPSQVTRCREKQQGIECMSAEMNMQLSSSRVVHRTRTIISDFNAEGEFKLAYEKDVFSNENKTVASSPVKTGLQSNGHVLDCSLQAGRTISCAQGEQKQYRFFGHN